MIKKDLSVIVSIVKKKTTTTTTLQQIIFNTFLFKKQKMVMCYVWQHKIAVVSNIVYYSKT